MDLMLEALARRFDEQAPTSRPTVSSPLELARLTSRGRWIDARHFDVMEEAVLKTIETGGRLAISVPVRHGKSLYVSRMLPAWYLGTNPHKRALVWCHESTYAATHGAYARDILIEYGPDLFGVRVSRRSEAASRWDLAPPWSGGMATFGVGGAPIGRGGDLVIGDDPLKSFAAAMSPLQRARVHEHYTGTIVSRIEPGGAVILIEARWHHDDLTGFLLREAPDEWSVLRLAALCDDPENDPLGRKLGDPLWEERYDRDELLRRQRETSLALGSVVWMAQYQQAPTSKSGGMFPEAKWRFIQPGLVPDGLQWTRAWDLAASEDQGDWTVTARIARLPDGRFIIDDVRRGQWEGHVWRPLMRRLSDEQPTDLIELPQDPGQAGKDQAQQLISMLAGRVVHARTQTGSKDVRAGGYSAQQKAGNVLLVVGDWNGPFISEHEQFPRGTHDDQVDAATTGFNSIAGFPSMPAESKSPAEMRIGVGSARSR